MVIGECTLDVSTKEKTIKEATGKINALNVRSIKVIIVTDEGEEVELEVHDYNFNWKDEIEE